MKKNTILIETAAIPSAVSFDNRLKEKKFTEENSTVIKNKMDVACAFIGEHGLADVTKLKRK